jgi:hypothetical protein
MRAREFLSEKKEGKISKRAQQPTAGLNVYSDAERWNSDYVAYRLGMAVACSDGHNSLNIDAKSWVGKQKSANPYTSQEQDMLVQAFKAVGADYTDLNGGDMKSKELDNTNVVSPVAQWQKPAKKAKK